MCKLVTFCCEESEKLDQKLCLVKPSKWKGKGKVSWDIPILPLTKGGVKILDLEAQIIDFLTKMLIRRFTLGPKPWKVFSCHQVHNLKQSTKGGGTPQHDGS